VSRSDAVKVSVAILLIVVALAWLIGPERDDQDYVTEPTIERPVDLGGNTGAKERKEDTKPKPNPSARINENIG
jgi:hypothetical protein